MYLSIVIFAVCLPLFALALPSFHIVQSPFANDPKVVKIFYDCSIQCTGDRKAAEVLLSRTPLFKSPQSLQPFCEKSQCMEDCVLPKVDNQWIHKAGFDVAKIECTDENYAKSYECMNEQAASVEAKCSSSRGSDICEVFINAVNCIVGAFTEKCGESGGQAYKLMADVVLSALGCQ